MDIYASLLTEIGIVHDIPKDIVNLQINKTQDEIEYEWECEQSGETLVLDYDMEQERHWKKKHRYVRKSRFKSILFNLLNIRGSVPMEIKNHIKNKLSPQKSSPSKIWNSVRAILKELNLTRKYFNLIPDIIKHCIGLSPKTEYGVIDLIIHDFHIMHSQFDDLAIQWNRKYFLNLRYVALCLINRHGIIYPYNVPILRTARKQTYLNTLMNDFNLDVDAKENQGFNGKSKES